MDTAIITEAAGAVLPDVVALRREIHAEPELGTDNPLTQKRILEALSGLGLAVSVGDGISSVVADLEGGQPGPTILLRADTDALPMTEESGEPFTSTIEGRAHACGHDAHVAMLVGAARVLADTRDELPGRVRFAFQPGEEGYGGAVQMIEQNLLDGVDGAFAIHISPNLPAGMLSTRPGPLLASADEFVAVVRGAGGHASTPHFAHDPIPVACEIVSALQTFVTRRLDAFNPAVVTVARITAGTTSNVIPETAELEGTVRTVSEMTRMAALAAVERIPKAIASAHECTAEVEIKPGYPVTSCDASWAGFVGEVAEQQLGGGKYFEMPNPVMGAEDFSYVLQKTPGAMAFLGVCPSDIEHSTEAPSCHSNKMRLHEPSLAAGIAMHVAVVREFLDRRAELT